MISPYKAQVFAIQEKIQETCSDDAGGLFSLRVRSVDAFQGGEEDIIIVSTVRSNEGWVPCKSPKDRRITHSSKVF